MTRSCCGGGGECWRVVVRTRRGEWNGILVFALSPYYSSDARTLRVAILLKENDSRKASKQLYANTSIQLRCLALCRLQLAHIL